MYFGGARKKRDISEKPIIHALKQAGCDVWQINGSGLPDLLVRTRAGILHAFEVKTGNAKLRATQGAFPVVRTPEEALTAIQAVRTLTQTPHKPNQTSGIMGSDRTK